MSSLQAKIAAWPFKYKELLAGSVYEGADNKVWDGDGTYTCKANPQLSKCKRDAEKNASLVILQRECIEELVRTITDCLSDTAERAELGISCTTEIDEDDGCVCYPWGNGVNVALHGAITAAQELLTKTKV